MKFHKTTLSLIVAFALGSCDITDSEIDLDIDWPFHYEKREVDLSIYLGAIPPPPSGTIDYVIQGKHADERLGPLAAFASVEVTDSSFRVVITDSNSITVRSPGTSWVDYGWGAVSLTGSGIVRITKYDTLRQLISGEFALRMKFPDMIPDSFVIVRGAFTELPRKRERELNPSFRTTVFDSTGKKVSSFTLPQVSAGGNGGLGSKSVSARTKEFQYPSRSVRISWYGPREVGHYSRYIRCYVYGVAYNYLENVEDSINFVKITEVDIKNGCIQGEFKLLVQEAATLKRYYIEGAFTDVPWKP